MITVFCRSLESHSFLKGAFQPELKPFVGRLAENDGLGRALNVRTGSTYSSRYGLRIDPTRAKNGPSITGTKDWAKRALCE